MAIAFRAINSGKMRSALTTLGIVIGIVAVTAMATVVNGLEKGFEQDMESLGTDVLYIQRWPWGGPVKDWWNYINRPRITQDLGDAIEERSRYAVAATPVVQTGRSVTAGQNSLAVVPISGNAFDYTSVHTVDIAEGHFLTEVDDRSARHVAVLGADVAEKLFPIQQPLGKSIRIGGNRFTVIGVEVKEGSGAGGPNSADNNIRIPFSTFEKLYGARWRDVSVEVKVNSPENLLNAKDEITGILRVARKLDAREPDDFVINEQTTLRAQIEPVKRAIYLIGIGLTALSLLVGGIGVMNIMFVSVKERTREIGVRKAVGATRRNILVQFLIEAVMICLVGGILGTLIALPISFLVRAFLPASFDLVTLGIAFGICVVVGVVFGLAPAWTAAKARPIEALRYE